MSRQRILCLHGFTSNGQVHAFQVRRLVQALPEFDLIFPDGPHAVDLAADQTDSTTPIPPQQQAWINFVQQTSTAGHRAWWFSRDPDPGTGRPGDYDGIEKSLEVVGDLVRRHGGVDAIWGFSQGACFAAMLCALLQDSHSEHPLRKVLGPGIGVPRAGVVFSGFRARMERFDDVYEGGIGMPMLHVYGEGDQQVVPERSERLIEVCRDAVTIVHEGGHEIPRSEDCQGKIVRFLRRTLGSGNGLAVSL